MFGVVVAATEIGIVASGLVAQTGLIDGVNQDFGRPSRVPAVSTTISISENQAQAMIEYGDAQLGSTDYGLFSANCFNL
jgi:hypothetical protein